MVSKQSIFAAGFVLLASAVAAIAEDASAKADPRPNIVVFLSDDHGQLDSTPYGATDVRTPNMQRLADAGMTFTHAFVASPSCAPSRSALLTGLMPARNGAEANHSFKRKGVASLPDVLRKLGYQTAAFGKVAHGRTDVKRHGFDVHNNRHDIALVKKFLDERSGDKPLALFVGTHEPHVPWPDLEGYDPAKLDVPATHVDTPQTREFRARYYTDITKADTQLGELYDLAREKLGENTLFVYTSDHGAQWPFGKWNLYDAGIRVPLLVAWPGKVKAGSKTDAMVSWIDILPTLIEAAGGHVPEGIDGRSFLPVLRGEQQTHRTEIFTTHSGDGRMNVYPIRSLRTQNWKYILNLHPELAHTTHIDLALARDGGYYFRSWAEAARGDKAALAIVRRYHQRPREELYDLARDPLEQHNLAADPQHTERLAQMRSAVESWMKAQHDDGKLFNVPHELSEVFDDQHLPVVREYRDK